MRRLLDEIDEVGIEIEVQAVGIGIVLGRTVRDDRSRLCNHPGDAERPADRRGDAEPQRQPRRQAECAEADDDQKIFESGLAQAHRGRLVVFGERIGRDDEDGQEHDVNRRCREHEPRRTAARPGEPVVDEAAEEEHEQGHQDVGQRRVPFRDRREYHRYRKQRRRTRPELQPSAFAFRRRDERAQPVPATLLQLVLGENGHGSSIVGASCPAHRGAGGNIRRQIDSDSLGGNNFAA